MKLLFRASIVVPHHWTPGLVPPLGLMVSAIVAVGQAAAAAVVTNRSKQHHDAESHDPQ